jgi:VWFA-related protein
MLALPLTVLVAASLAAAQAPAPATPQPPQTFRSATSVVEVDARVFKEGRFVTDLGPADFEITEDGVPQKIESVTLIGARPAPSVSAPSAPSAPSPAPSAPPAASVASAPSVWLFVFDTAHLTPAGLQRTRDAVATFLDGRWREGDIGGVVSDGKMANNRLTSVRDELRAAVKAIKLPGDLASRQMELKQAWPRFQDEYEVMRVAVDNDRETIAMLSQRACADDPGQCKMIAPDAAIREKANRLFRDIQRATLNTLATVQALANGLARMPGPKTVVFLSEGFVAENFEAQIRQAVGDAGRAGAHFYTIDARGLNKGSQASAINQLAADQPGTTGVHFDAQADGTNSLAVDTGGIAIRNENNFARALDEIQQDAATYYVIAYSPANTTFDGKYRAIGVNVKRPGVNVRARKGYLAIAPARMLTAVPASRVERPTGAKGARGAGSENAAGAPSTPASSAPSAASVPSAPSASVPSAPPVPSATSPSVPSAASAPPAPSPPPSSLSAPLARLAPTGPSSTDSAAAVRGWEAYQRGDLESAARELSAAAAAADARPWVFYALGLSHFALQRYRDAVDAWERVRRTTPEFEPIYFSLADAYSLQHDEGAAIKALRDAEQRWPADPEVADAIGVIQVRRGALDAAIDSFEHAVAIGSGEGLGYFNLARAYQMRLAKSQHYDAHMERWVGGEEDRRRAIANFQKYLELGGPYENQAREAIAALQWK